jgi:hypothetical protein
VAKQNYEHHPRTIPEAVNWILVRLSDTVRKELLNIPEDQVIGITHHGLGRWIRNNVLRNNIQLQKAIGGKWNDDRSPYLVMLVYDRLKKGIDVPKQIDSLIIMKWE